MHPRSVLVRLIALNLVVGLATVGILEAAGIHVFDHAGRAALALTLVGVTAIVLAVATARSITQPIHRIADEITHLARGRFASVDSSGPAETRELSDAVNDMAEELARRVEALRTETDLREQILGAMEEAVVLSENGSVVYANRAAGVLLGAEAGRPAPPQAPRPNGDGATVAEFAVHHPVYRDLRATAAPLPDGRTLVVAQDVTDARRIDRIRRDFVANASHEMKTPVAGILATAETLQDAIRDDPAVAERFAGNLGKEAQRLSNLISDLLDLARLDQAQAEQEAIVPLSKVVREVIEEERPLADNRRLSIDTTVAEGVTVSGRAHDLALMARNLLENALRYTPEGGRIKVELKLGQGTAILSIHDTGIGIPAKDLPRIFERFYRVDKARARDTGGTGLGLSIVRHIAESHGGRVTAESELGRGSTFRVSLPIRSIV